MISVGRYVETYNPNVNIAIIFMLTCELLLHKLQWENLQNTYKWLLLSIFEMNTDFYLQWPVKYCIYSEYWKIREKTLNFKLLYAVEASIYISTLEIYQNLCNLNFYGTGYFVWITWFSNDRIFLSKSLFYKTWRNNCA